MEVEEIRHLRWENELGIMAILFPALSITCQIWGDKKFPFVYILNGGFGSFLDNNLQRKRELISLSEDKNITSSRNMQHSREFYRDTSPLSSQIHDISTLQHHKK